MTSREAREVTWEEQLSRRAVGSAVLALSGALSAAWLVEASTSGRGFISTCLAPVAVVGIFAGSWLRRAAPSGHPPTRRQGRPQVPGR